MAEVAVARARRDDQIVVVDFGLGGVHDAAVKVEAADFGHEHFNIFVGAKNGANWRGDFRGKVRQKAT